MTPGRDPEKAALVVPPIGRTLVAAMSMRNRVEPLSSLDLLRIYQQTSSIAVLNGEPGVPMDETCLRDLADADDDYYRSKIMADQVVSALREARLDPRLVTNPSAPRRDTINISVDAR